MSGPGRLFGTGDPVRLAPADIARRIRHRPAWLLDDLAPTAEERADLAGYARGVALWYRLRQGGFTMLGCRRGRTLRRLAADAERQGVEGALVDCGVWNGGSSVLLASGAPGRQTWCFDSFAGLPAPSADDGERSVGWHGACHGSVAAVASAFSRFAPSTPYRIVEGWFADTFPTVDIPSIAVLHADGDWHDSIDLTLRTFYPRLAEGGFVIVDDYGLWDGARRATDTFRAEAGIAAPLRSVDGNAVCWQKC